MIVAKKMLAIVALVFCVGVAVSTASGTAHAATIRIDPNGAP